MAELIVMVHSLLCRVFRTCLLRLAAILLFSAQLTAAGSAPSNQFKEYEVKAAFLLRFIEFAQWPPSALGAASEPFVIAIVGSDPFGQVIDRLAAGQTAFGRPVVVRRIPWGPAVGKCEVLFVPADQSDKISQIAKWVQSKPVLTVGESPGFAHRHGIVNFFLESGRVRFEINNEAAKAANLSLSSRLLSLAKLVVGERAAK